MRRYRSYFTKNNIKKFTSLDAQSQAMGFVIGGICAIILASLLVVVVISLDATIVPMILFFPILWIVLGIVFLILGIAGYNKIKEIKKDEQEYNKKLLNSNIENIDTFSGKEFEYFCKVLFEKQSYEVKTTRSSGDYGVDLILIKDDIKFAGQCKRSKNKISVSAVQEIVAGKNYYNANRGFIITNSFFTKPAIDLANANSIKLIDRKQLVEMIYETKNIQ